MNPKCAHIWRCTPLFCICTCVCHL